MAQINNLTDIRQDISTAYFNNYFKPEYVVSQDVDNSILGYFESIAANKISAKALAGAVIYTARAQNLDPMVVLQKFTSLPTPQIKAYLTMFLNLNRVGTSMLGVSNAPLANKYVERTILS
jgi:hypothetical protein